MASLQRLVLVLFRRLLMSMSALPTGELNSNSHAHEAGWGRLRGGDPARRWSTTHEGTGVARKAMTDVNGEFVLSCRRAEWSLHSRVEDQAVRRVQDHGAPAACSSRRGTEPVRRAFALADPHIQGDGDGGQPNAAHRDVGLRPPTPSGRREWELPVDPQEPPT